MSLVPSDLTVLLVSTPGGVRQPPSELPPIVVSELFGVSASNAHTWAGFAQDSWADYLAACQPDVE